eukprot:scaffold129113_cov47-Attheya_sp.AAC.1
MPTVRACPSSRGRSIDLALVAPATVTVAERPITRHNGMIHYYMARPTSRRHGGGVRMRTSRTTHCSGRIPTFSSIVATAVA